MVTMGGQATRRAWMHTTARSARPLARATVMYSWPRISSTAARVMRVMMAAGAAAVVTAGRIRWASRSPNPPSPRDEFMPRLGSQRRWSAKIVISTSSEPEWRHVAHHHRGGHAHRSTALRGRAADSTPSAMPPPAARKKLAPARIIVLPSLGRRMSRTGLVDDRREAEVALERSPEPLAVLDVERLVQAERGAELRKRRVASYRAEERARDVPRDELHGKEDHHRDAEQHRHEPEEALGDVAGHAEDPSFARAAPA